MQVIKVHHPLRDDQIVEEPVVLAMGFFDGVHRGHQEVLQTAKKIADDRGVKLAVLTYDHHPGVVYKQMKAPLKYISTTSRKLELLEEQGADIVYLLSFTSALAKLKPQAFVDQYIVRMNTVVAVAGFDHTYGPKDTATMQLLPQYAHDRFDVKVVDEQLSDHQKISSSAVREVLKNGEVQHANELLGYTFQTTGLIVHGLARGRQLGFPTANVDWQQDEWLPKVGVYAVRMKIGDSWFNGMASVGYNITFNEDTGKTVEINLFDFEDEIYGESVKVAWVAWLRDEVKYTGPEALVAQLKQDELDARKILE